jgi:hypothetical protein
MQFRPPPPPQIREVRPAHRPPRNDRGCPLRTARDRCLWHAGGTAGENDHLTRGGDGSQLVQRLRPVLGDHRLVGKPRMRRGSSCGPVWSRTPPALRSSATRDRSAGRARQGRSWSWPLHAVYGEPTPRLPGLPDLLWGLRSVKRQSKADRSSSFSCRITAYGEYTISCRIGS